MYDRTSREARERIEAEMRQITNRCDREGKRGLNTEERARWERLADSHSVLENRIARNEGGSGVRGSGRISETSGLEEIQDSFRLTPSAFRERQRDPHAKAFTNFLRRGVQGLDGAEAELMRQSFVGGSGSGFQNAQTLVGSGGGYLVPTGF